MGHGRKARRPRDVLREANLHSGMRLAVAVEHVQILDQLHLRIERGHGVGQIDSQGRQRSHGGNRDHAALLNLRGMQ
jgi:hypothetical protein